MHLQECSTHEFLAENTDLVNVLRGDRVWLLSLEACIICAKKAQKILNPNKYLGCLTLAPLLALNTKQAIMEGKDQLRISKENKAEKGMLQIVEKEWTTKIWKLSLCHLNPLDSPSPTNSTKTQGNEKMYRHGDKHDKDPHAERQSSGLEKHATEGQHERALKKKSEAAQKRQDWKDKSLDTAVQLASTNETKFQKTSNCNY